MKKRYCLHLYVCTFICVDMVQEGKQESRTFLCVSVKEKKNRVHLFVLALGTVYLLINSIDFNIITVKKTIMT